MVEHCPHSHLLFLPPNTICTFCSPSKEYPQLFSSLILKRVFTSASNPQLRRARRSVSGNKGTGSSALLHQEWNSLSFTGEKGQQQEAGKRSIALEGLFSSEKYLHLRICFSEQTRLSLTTHSCCFVLVSPGHSEKRLTSPYSYPASPPPCLFWPVFHIFSRFL